jgi:hypothetical protein
MTDSQQGSNFVCFNAIIFPSNVFRSTATCGTTTLTTLWNSPGRVASKTQINLFFLTFYPICTPAAEISMHILKLHAAIDLNRSVTLIHQETEVERLSIHHACFRYSSHISMLCLCHNHPHPPLLALWSTEDPGFLQNQLQASLSSAIFLQQHQNQH